MEITMLIMGWAAAALALALRWPLSGESRTKSQESREEEAKVINEKYNQLKRSIKLQEGASGYLKMDVNSTETPFRATRPFYTPDLCGQKIVVMGLTLRVIDNYIQNVLKDNPYSMKYHKETPSGVLINFEKRVIEFHLLVGWERIIGKTGIDVLSSHYPKAAIINYGEQLSFNISTQ